MFILSSFDGAIAALAVGLCCWGSWGVILKTSGLKYEASTVHFVYSQTIMSLVACFTLGMVPTDKSEKTFIDALQNVDVLGALATLLGGALVAFANALLTKAINIGGVALAVPAVIGTGLIGGTVLNYLVEPKGIAWLLFAGIACCVVAIILDAITYKLKEQDEATLAKTATSAEPANTTGDVEVATEKTDAEACSEAVPRNTSTASGGSKVALQRQFTFACIAGGVLSSLYSPLSTWASTHRGLDPYELLFFFNLGQLFVIPVYLSLLIKGDAQLDLGTLRQKLLCILAGFINCGGLIAMFIAGNAVSFAMSFGILQCSPVIAALWGLYFGEMSGASRLRAVCFCSMMVMYCLAIAGIATSQI